jgi:hypothetical protein
MLQRADDGVVSHVTPDVRWCCEWACFQSRHCAGTSTTMTKASRDSLHLMGFTLLPTSSPALVKYTMHGGDLQVLLLCNININVMQVHPAPAAA